LVLETKKKTMRSYQNALCNLRNCNETKCVVVVEKEERMSKKNTEWNSKQQSVVL
jgi:hypothetical protein